MAKNAIRIFLGLWVVTLIGFWPTFFTRLDEVPIQGYLHGIAVFGWFLLLLVQAVLIHRRRNALHRALGKISYAWAPLVVVATLVAARHFLSLGDNPPMPGNLALLAIILPLVASFALLYALAIRHRRKMALHARYMTATGIVFVVPAWSRVLGYYVLPALGIIGPDGTRTLQQFVLPDHLALTIMQLFTLILLLSDWRGGRDPKPYGLCLLLLVLTQTALMWLPLQDWWIDVARFLMM